MQNPTSHKHSSSASLSREIPQILESDIESLRLKLPAIGSVYPGDIDDAMQAVEDLHRWTYDEVEATLHCAIVESLAFCNDLTRGDIYETIIHVFVGDNPPDTRLYQRIDSFLRTLFFARYIRIESRVKDSKSQISLTPAGMKLGHWVVRNPGNVWPPNEVLLPERRRQQQ